MIGLALFIIALVVVVAAVASSIVFWGWIAANILPRMYRLVDRDFREAWRFEGGRVEVLRLVLQGIVYVILFGFLAAAMALAIYSWLFENGS